MRMPIISLIRLIRRHKIKNADARISLIREIRSFPVRFVRVNTAFGVGKPASIDKKAQKMLHNSIILFKTRKNE
jgi:hypothetical protein